MERYINFTIEIVENNHQQELNIRLLVNKFEQTGSVVAEKFCGRPLSSHDTIKSIREEVKRRQCSQVP